MIDSFSVCYHGTIDVYSEKIMDNIDVSAGRFFTDFIDIDFLRQANGLTFDSPSDKWAEFVYNCRKEGLSDRIYHNYDYICGPLADGRTAPLVKQLIKGAISLQDFHSQVSPRRFEDQLSFNKLRALECITDMEVFTIEKLTPAG